MKRMLIVLLMLSTPVCSVGAASGIDQSKRTVLVAVVDTGVDLEHPALQGHLARASNGELLGLNLVSPDHPPFDENGHGTHIASVVLTNAGGNAQIMPAKVLRADGRGSASDIALGIRWSVDQGAQLISVSSGILFYRPELAEAVRYAWDHNALVIAAGGNHGEEQVVYPAGNLYALGVGASTAEGGVATFSNRGIHIRAMAPGVEVEAALPTYPVYATRYGFPLGHGRMSGTSQAAAQVTGLAARMWAGEPDLTVEQVYQRMIALPASQGAVYGQVRDSAGEPVPTATVSMGPYQTMTNQDGMFRISNSIPGIYLVEVAGMKHEGTITGTVVLVAPGRETLLELRYQSVPEFAPGIALVRNLSD